MYICKRYIYLPVSVVSNPDSQIKFSTTDIMLEQTWQPEIKAIRGYRYLTMQKMIFPVMYS